MMQSRRCRSVFQVIRAGKERYGFIPHLIFVRKSDIFAIPNAWYNAPSCQKLPLTEANRFCHSKARDILVLNTASRGGFPNRPMNVTFRYVGKTVYFQSFANSGSETRIAIPVDYFRFRHSHGGTGSGSVSRLTEKLGISSSNAILANIQIMIC